MQVILKQDVKKIGKQGDVVNVAEGYARNYLIPRGLAVQASKGNLRSIQEEKKTENLKEQRRKSEAKAIAEQLQDVEITIPVKAGTKGKLFGSINTKDIADALSKEKDIDLDRKCINLSEPIKSLGNFAIEVKSYPGITTTLNLKVINIEMEGED